MVWGSGFRNLNQSVVTLYPPPYNLHLSNCILHPAPCTSRGRRKVGVRPPGKGNSNFHGAWPVHLIITMIKWMRIIRLSIRVSLSVGTLSGPKSAGVSDSNYQSTLDAEYVYVVPWSEFPIVLSFPHFPHGAGTTGYEPFER